MTGGSSTKREKVHNFLWISTQYLHQDVKGSWAEAIRACQEIVEVNTVCVVLFHDWQLKPGLLPNIILRNVHIHVGTWAQGKISTSTVSTVLGPASQIIRNSKKNVWMYAKNQFLFVTAVIACAHNTYFDPAPKETTSWCPSKEDVCVKTVSSVTVLAESELYAHILSYMFLHD